MNLALFALAAALAQPNPALTPGAIDPAVTQGNITTTICVPGYTQIVRKNKGGGVTMDKKREVMKRYGQPVSKLHGVEIDHYISLEIGGLNDITNLWPQPMAEARHKDVVETWLHRQVCAGKLSLMEAQERVRIWPEIYGWIKGGK